MTNQSYKDQIIGYIKSRGQTRADDLWRHFQLSRVLIHRYLKELLLDGRLARVGKPPLVFYVYFYSLPKFGKTRLGQLVLYAKQTQKISLVKDIIPLFRRIVKDLIKRFDIDAVGFIPPTIPRKFQFQKEIEKQLVLKLPRIELVKAYIGDIPVAQNILPTADPVGSGATLNETANKLKQTGVAIRVIGVAVVGSYKGFDVIREI